MDSNDNLFSKFQEQFPATGVAIECGGRSFTYEELDALSAVVANNLTDLGLVKGDTVSVIGDKSLNFLWLYLGCLRAGFVFHPLNPAYTFSEIQFFIKDACPRLVVASQSLEDKFNIEIKNKNTKILFFTEEDEDKLFGVRTEQDKVFETVNSLGSETAALLYSSGTTGGPKGIRLTHANLFSNADTLKTLWQFSEADTVLHVLPVFHVHGLFILLGPSLLSGCRVKYLLTFDVERIIFELGDSTVMAGVPTYYSRLLSSPDFNELACSSVRVFISGSAPLSEKIFEEFLTRTGKAIVERYGMTETGVNTSNPINGNRIAGSVGPALPGVQLRISNKTGESLGANEVGSIEVKGDNVFPGYWNLPEQNAGAFTVDGWFMTGDQGYLDDDKYLYILGRSKDMIISGGLNVYSKEVEREIEENELVAEAAVFGVPHSDFGEAVVAAVVMRDYAKLNQSALLVTLSLRLASYKVPKQIIALDDFPRNAMGKVQKVKLRKTYEGLFS